MISSWLACSEEPNAAENLCGPSLKPCLAAMQTTDPTSNFQVPQMYPHAERGIKTHPWQLYVPLRPSHTRLPYLQLESVHSCTAFSTSSPTAQLGLHNVMEMDDIGIMIATHSAVCMAAPYISKLYTLLQLVLCNLYAATSEEPQKAWFP